MATEDMLRTGLFAAAGRLYGEERAAEMAKRLADMAHWLWLIDEQPVELLGEEPDTDGR